MMEGTRTKRLKKSKKTEASNHQETRDRLTELPEPLLHHILSYLTMEHVVRTSVLAKRWRYIWSSVRCLNFSPRKMPKYKEITLINRALLLHKGPKIHKLNITFNCNGTDACHVDSWIHFALARNVNELYLDLRKTVNCWFMLPLFIFSSSSLTVLALKSCLIDLPINFKLNSLKILSLDRVYFSGGDFLFDDQPCGDQINDLIFSSPNLEQLSLTNCRTHDNLNLRILHRNMKNLKIQESHYVCSSSSNLEVCAPFVVSFELITSMDRKNYIFRGMERLESAIFDFDGVDSKYFYEEDGRRTIVKILDDFRHVKVLRLCSCYIQALSSREEQNLDFLSFEVTCLGIKAGLTKWELPGISYMLRHSPNIETLIVTTIDKNERKKPSSDKSNAKFNFEDGEYWKLQELNFVNDQLCKLKTVKIYNFMNHLDVQPNTTAEELLAQLQNDMNFLRVLLENTKVLEKMVIKTCKNVDFGKSESKKLKMMFLLTKELLAFPRASRDVEILFD